MKKKVEEIKTRTQLDFREREIHLMLNLKAILKNRIK